MENVRDDAREVPDKVQEKLNGIEDIVKSYDKKIGNCFKRSTYQRIMI